MLKSKESQWFPLLQFSAGQLLGTDPPLLTKKIMEGNQDRVKDKIWGTPVFKNWSKREVREAAEKHDEMPMELQEFKEL